MPNMTDLPKIYFWHGKRVEDLSKKELIVALIETADELERSMDREFTRMGTAMNGPYTMPISPAVRFLLLGDRT